MAKQNGRKTIKFSLLQNLSLNFNQTRDSSQLGTNILSKLGTNIKIKKT